MIKYNLLQFINLCKGILCTACLTSFQKRKKKKEKKIVSDIPHKLFLCFVFQSSWSIPFICFPSFAAYRYGKFTSFSTLFKTSFEESTEYKSWEGDSELYTLILIPGNTVTINNALLQGIISLYKTILCEFVMYQPSFLFSSSLGGPWVPSCLLPSLQTLNVPGTWLTWL